MFEIPLVPSKHKLSNSSPRHIFICLLYSVINDEVLPYICIAIVNFSTSAKEPKDICNISTSKMSDFISTTHQKLHFLLGPSHFFIKISGPCKRYYLFKSHILEIDRKNLNWNQRVLDQYRYASKNLKHQILTWTRK